MYGYWPAPAIANTINLSDRFLTVDTSSKCPRASVLKIKVTETILKRKYTIVQALNVFSLLQMSLVVRKPAFCICENKDADQLRGSRESDQHLCFRYIDSTIPLLP